MSQILVISAVSSLLLSVPATAKEDQAAETHFVKICSKLTDAVARVPLPPLLSRDDPSAKHQLHTRLRLARLTSSTTGKITLSVQIGTDDVGQADILSFQLGYYKQHWTVMNYESTGYYSSKEGKERLLKLILLIDETQGE